MFKKEVQGHPHREHRSKKGRNPSTVFERANKREYRFKVEVEEFGKERYMKKRKHVKYR